jgi:hypothetical protein
MTRVSNGIVSYIVLMNYFVNLTDDDDDAEVVINNSSNQII